MRIAIFSDVHGNLDALDAVLDAIAKFAPDEIHFAGDLCFMGPQPGACLERIRDHKIAAIYGNHDHVLRGADFVPPPTLADDRLEWYQSNVHFTRAHLAEEQIGWLSRLPFGRRIAPTINPADDLLLVHASPYDIYRGLFPMEERQKEIWSKVLATDADMAERVAGITARTIVCGHIHVPGIRHIADHHIVNVGSVSLPADGDVRAKFGLLTWNGREWEASLHYVTYDIDAYLDTLRRSERPGWEADITKMTRLRS